MPPRVLCWDNTKHHTRPGAEGAWYQWTPEKPTPLQSQGAKQPSSSRAVLPPLPTTHESWRVPRTSFQCPRGMGSIPGRCLVRNPQPQAMTPQPNVYTLHNQHWDESIAALPQVEQGASLEPRIFGGTHCFSEFPCIFKYIFTGFPLLSLALCWQGIAALTPHV